MSANERDLTFEKPSAFSLWLNLLPFLHIISGLSIAIFGFASMSMRVSFGAAWLYLLPPLLARLCIAMFGLPVGRLTQDMVAYRVWWALTQLQTIFNRQPILEEALRLVPGLYPAWIGLWGGRLSQFAYVGPGVIIADRYSVRVGRGAVLGFGSALAGHMALRDEAGRWVVEVAGPVVEDEAILGGGAAMGPGAVLKRGHLLPSGRRLGPYNIWPQGKP